MLEGLTEQVNRLIYVPAEGMVHPGLSAGWVIAILGIMLLIVARTFIFSSAYSLVTNTISITGMPVIGGYLERFIRQPMILVGLRILAASVFLLVIYAGLFGTPVPERNVATVLTWTIWWSGVVISVFFVGTAWCAICPWDALANWLVRHRLWHRGSEASSLNLRVPKILRSVWPALFMLVGLTWLELGLGVTTSPYATALLALLMVVLATTSLAVYERKAFCRYFCAIGRTLGAYSAMAPVALRPVDPDVCANCKTLDCYHGTKDIEPCPTHLVMGRITQSTYCTSCGACVMSCPHENVNWRLRPVGYEITHASRPHWDEAWFILGLIALTLFHGFTMMPYWEDWMRELAFQIGDSGKLLTSFSIGMTVGMLLPVILFMAVIWITYRQLNQTEEYKRTFSALAFSILPLAFTYHLAHNLSHLVRESHNFWSVVLNPLGSNTLPLSMSEIHYRHMNPLISNDIIFALQGLLVLFGFWLSLRIAKHRLSMMINNQNSRYLIFLPILSYISVFSLVSLWLLMQPMIMRM
jgi:polyferredoxin